MKRLSLSTLLVASALALTAGTGCNRDQQQASNDQAAKDETKTIKKSASDAKEQIEQQAKAEKERVEAQAKASEQQIEAKKAEVKADAAKSKSQVDSEVQKIQNAGSAGSAAQSQAGTDQSSTSKSSDSKLTEQVQAALKSESDPQSSSAIQVTVADGVATLKGDVKSEEQKSQLEQKAKSVSGVTRVDNQLTVKQ
jgi:osmotically-inducible protein OsmY